MSTNTQSKRGRPTKYTKDLIMKAVEFAKSTAQGIKTALPAYEKSLLSDTQRKKKFIPSLKYVPFLVGAAKNGISIRNMMKKSAE